MVSNENQLSVFIDLEEHQKFNSRIGEIQQKALDEKIIRDSGKLAKKHILLSLIKKFNNDKKMRDEIYQEFKDSQKR